MPWCVDGRDNINTKYLEKFTEEYYNQETTLFLKKTQETLETRLDEIKENILKQMDDFYNKIIKIQKEGGAKITYINLSFLHTSIYFDEPCFRAEAYDEKWYINDAIADGYVDASWMFTEWDEYKECLNRYRKKHMDRQVREEALNMLLRKTVRIMTYHAMVHLKYILSDSLQSEILKQVEKAEHFYITYGEYKDWQRTMYAEQPVIDLCNAKEDIPRTFRIYEGCSYINKEIKSMDVNGSTFTNCRFKGCTLSNLTMNDCVFEQCTFERNQMDSVKFYGSTFIDCYFEDIVCNKVLFGLESRREETEDIYKPAEFAGCEMKGLTLYDCDLSDIGFIDCVGSNLTMEGGNRERSDFSWVSEGAEVGV